VQLSVANAASAVVTSGQGTPPASQQILDAIKSAIPAGGDAGQIQRTGDPTAANYEPVKVITIALQPEGLGTVSIQLSLKSSQLGLRLETSEASTAQLLRQSSGDLSGLLQSAGYAVGGIAVHSAPQPAQGDPQAQAGQGGQNSAFTSPGSGGGGTSGGGAAAGGQDRRQPESHGGQQEAGYGRPETANSDPSLYV
jgi:flagellar hook-length control protein FliK